MTYIKLTRDDGITRNDMQWHIGATNHATGDGYELCTNGVIHVYDSPEQAAFMRYVHCWDYTRAFEVESDDTGITDGTKRGIKSCTVLREIELPELTDEQRVEIAIRVSLTVYNAPYYIRWAENWLSGKNRSCDAAEKADFRTTCVSIYAASKSAYADADAADAASYAATSAAALATGRESAYVTDRTGAAAAYAVYIKQINLLSIIEQVIRKEQAE